MAITVKQSPLARHLMLLSMATGLLLLGLAGATHWRSLLAQVSQPSTPPSALPVPTSPQAQDTKLVVDLSDRQVVLYRHGKAMARYPVAVGQAGWETPIGQFKIHQLRQYPEWRHPITQQVFPAGAGNPLGSRWIGFYQGEYMALGFHGTPNESLIGQAVSHGCLRMRNRDIEALYQKVGLGVIVVVQR